MLATLRNRDFALLWTAGLVSQGGNWVLLTALPYFVYERTGSTLASGLIWVAYFLPGLLFGSVAGVFVDRWDRRRTMVWANLLQAGLMLGLAAVGAGGPLWPVYLLVLGEATLAQFFTPAENALLPSLVGEERLPTANALNSLNDNLARVAGPAVGGVLAARFGLTGAALADALSFLLAAGLIGLIAPARVPKVAASGRGARSGAEAARDVWREWAQGLRVVRGSPVLRAVFIVMGVSLLGDSILTAMLVPWVREYVGGGAQALGALFTIRGVAGLLGGVVIGWVGGRVRPERMLGPCLLVVGLLFMVQVNFPYLWLLVGLLLLNGPFIIGWLSSQQTLLQTGAPDQYRGRVFGAFMTTSSLTLLIGSGVGSALGDVVGVLPLLNAAAALYTLAGAVALALLPAAARRGAETREPAGRS
jgi:MFS family permease